MTRKETVAVSYLLSELRAGIQEIRRYARDFDCSGLKSVEEKLTKVTEGFNEVIRK